MTVVLELPTAILEYPDLFNGIVQSADFLAVKALLSPQNASIIQEFIDILSCLSNLSIKLTVIRK